jgi:hypothetical protein
MSCLSPIQESLSGENSYGTAMSPHSSYMGHSPMRNVSAFSSWNDLKAQQRQLQSTNKNVRLKMGGVIPRDFVMRAIPESHFGKVKRMSSPTEADFKVLGLELDEEGSEKNIHEMSHPNQNREIRDETPGGGISSEKRSEAELPGDAFAEDDDSVGKTDILPANSFDNVSSLGTILRGASERARSGNKRPKIKMKLCVLLKKPIGKIAKGVWRKAKALFRKKKIPQLERSKGVLT